jgi:hypothetical protein
MARWSSSASELVDAAPAGAEGAARASAHPGHLSWVLRPGLLTGSPWPRLAIGLVWGLPAGVVMAWALAWLGAWGAGLFVAAFVLLAWVWVRRPGASLKRPVAPTVTLSWQGPWPGELAASARRRKARPEARRAHRAPHVRPDEDHDDDDDGFRLEGEPVWPRVRLQWGPHLCLQCTAHQWAWLTLGDRASDRALQVLLRTLSQPVLNPGQADARTQAGGSLDEVASCEAWNDALARRRARAQAEATDMAETGPEDSDDFPATIIMKHDTGTELEPRRPHG